MTTCRPKRTMRKLSLFSGIGGLDLAAKLAGIETIAFCEREAFPCKVLAHRFPGIPIYDDVRTLTAAQLRKDGIIGYGKPLDLLSAGYPCQPFSSAGKRLGEADDRHLWPEVARLLYELRPTWFIGENVAGHVSMGLDDVLSDLASIGYEARVFLIPACAVGAPHRRDRIFIVGYTDIPPEWSLDANRRADELDQATEAEQLKQLFTDHIGTHVDWEKTIAAHLGEAGPAKQPDIATRFRAATQDVADAIGFPSDRTIDHQPECQIAPNEFNGVIEITGSTDGRFASGDIRMGREGGFEQAESRIGRAIDGLSDWLDRFKWPAPMGAPQYDWEPPRTVPDVPNRVARLKALGNAVNPIQVLPIFILIREIHDYMHAVQLMTATCMLGEGGEQA